MTEVPLSEVVRRLGQQNRELGNLDEEISQRLRQVEAALRAKRPTERPIDVPFPPWGKLGWSGRRGRWRLVVVDDEECEDLLNMPRRCRTDACLVLSKLVDRIGAL